MLGTAYEYLIKYFADSAGKKGGEFYTPAEVVRLMVQIVKPQEGDSIYDPTVGSGGMLIQSHQYIEENNENLHNIKLYGQENDGGVWATCIMNMILHDVKDFEIEHGNTLEEPLFKEIDGRYKKFDKILANPPFSQNYKKENLTQTSRFKWGYAPESKKADLMFVQHMASSLKKNGVMACVVPHGVLFRGSKEKEIRAAMLEDNIIDAIIGLPPALFYGTGIPAAILVVKKNRKEDEPILFINADNEYAEEKARNKLRARDIEKISYVYHSKDTTNPKYSRVVTINEIREQEYNLNIRRYVDNSKEAEIEDVRGHIKGGVPLKEIDVYKEQYAKFEFSYKKVLDFIDDSYLKFMQNDSIKEIIEDDSDVKNTIETYQNHLKSWWEEAKDEFSQLQETKNINRAKEELLNSFKEYFKKLHTLDKFQISGVFVQWWNSIKYDLKTISSIGFNESLLSDEMLIEAFFQDEKEEIEKLEIKLSTIDSELNEAIEDVEYEPDSDKDDEEAKKTSKSAKAHLKSEINRLEFEEDDEYVKEREHYKKQLEKIEGLESEKKETKALKEKKEQELKYKLEAKRYGDIEYSSNLKKSLTDINNSLEDLKEVKSVLIEFDDVDKEIKLKTAEQKKIDKKDKSARDKIKAQIDELKSRKKELTQAKKKYKNELNTLKKLQKDKVVVKEALQELQTIKKNTQILTPLEAKELTLKKHLRLIENELNSGLKEELNALIAIFENLNEKYTRSLEVIEKELKDSEDTINGYLKALGYFDE